MYETIYAAAVLLAVGGVNSDDFPPHPRLLLDSDGVARLKQKIETVKWAKSSWEQLKKRADELLATSVELPPRGGNWYHYYACPTHGARLTEGKKIGAWQWEHVCPVDGEILKGDLSHPSRDYDGCAISSVHQSWALSVRDLGVAYRISGDRRYAAKAAEILLAYADAYSGYPLHNIRGEAQIGGGRVGSQSLDESVWLIPICQGADLVWDTLGDPERRQIAEKLLLEAVRTVILPHKLGVHNIQCWKNSAVGLVGFLLGDQDLINAAVDNPETGYHAQLTKGVTEDGAWWEGAWGYHFYTMSALWPLAEAARNCGVDLYGPEFKRMFDAPLKFAMPNLHLPAFNDSSEVDLTKSSGIYELGYARYRDPAFVPVIADSGRSNNYAFWFGEPQLPGASSQERKSANYPASGYAILTSGTGENATWLCFKYGPYGGGHGHPDKLSFVLYARGKVIAVDPGTALYGLPIQDEWFRTSLAHNTLIVDEISQRPVDGKLVSFGNEHGYDYVAADAGDIYEGVRFVRKIALLERNLIAVIDEVAADRPRTLDIAYHQLGKWVNLEDGQAWDPPEKPGYCRLKDTRIRKLDGAVDLVTQVANDWRVATSICADEGSELITALGPALGGEDPVPCAIVRKAGSQNTVLWTIALDGKPARVERVADEFQIRSAEGKVWHLKSGVVPNR